jgi:hypothetical protein
MARCTGLVARPPLVSASISRSSELGARHTARTQVTRDPFGDDHVGRAKSDAACHLRTLAAEGTARDATTCPANLGARGSGLGARKRAWPLSPVACSHLAITTINAERQSSQRPTPVLISARSAPLRCVRRAPHQNESCSRISERSRSARGARQNERRPDRRPISDRLTNR